MSENRQYYPALNGLRALALVMVFGGHYLHLPWAFTGVDLFFVLSGFLITGILYDTRDAEHRVRIFYTRRTLRIFPLYYGVFLSLLALTPIYHWQWNWYWMAWPLYLGNFLRFLFPYSQAAQLAGAAQLHGGAGHNTIMYLGHLWSLCVEEQFYLAWPWVVFGVKDRRRLIWICVAFVIACPFARWGAIVSLPSIYGELEIGYSFTLLRVDALLLGGLVALLWRGPERERLLTCSRWIASVGLPLFLLYVLMTTHLHGDPNYPAWRLTWGLSLVDILTAALIVAALRETTWAFKAFNLRPLRWFGTITYGAYVFHDIPQVFYNRMGTLLSRYSPFLAEHLRWTVAGVALVGTTALASLSFRFFETPFLNLKSRLAPAPKQASLPAEGRPLHS